MKQRKRRIGLRTRVAFSFAVLSALLSLLLTGITYFLIQSSALERREETTLESANADARQIKDTLVNAIAAADSANESRAASLGDAVPRSTAAVATVLWVPDPVAFERDPALAPQAEGDGLVFVSLPAVVDGVGEFRQLADIVATGQPATQRIHLDSGIPAMIVGIPMVLQTGSTAQPTRVMFFEIASLEDLQETLANLLVALLAAGGATTVAGAMLGRWVSKRVLAPLGDVNDAVKAIAANELDTRLPSTADPDLAPLIASFNDMVAALQTRIERDGRFASDVSHELRSPLTTLTASVHVLEQHDAELPDPVKQAVLLLGEEFQRFQQLVSDLLEISRFDAGAQRLDASAIVIGEFIRLAAGQVCPPGIPVKVDPNLEEGVILADKRRLMQVITNLATNAAKYAGGVTEIEVRHADGGIDIVVTDAGPGIDAADRVRIFERFARGVTAGKRGSDQGTGLGLALVNEHLRLHNGHITVEGRADSEAGSSFVVYLPGQPVSVYDAEEHFEAAGIGGGEP